jgi:hypothetical protein
VLELPEIVSCYIDIGSVDGKDGTGIHPIYIAVGMGCNPKQILEGIDGVGYPLSAIRSI